MACTATKSIKSQYKGVWRYEKDGKTYWALKIRGASSKSYPTEREDAIAVDMYYINKGKEPKNILKSKSNGKE